MIWAGRSTRCSFIAHECSAIHPYDLVINKVHPETGVTLKEARCNNLSPASGTWKEVMEREGSLDPRIQTGSSFKGAGLYYPDTRDRRTAL